MFNGSLIDCLTSTGKCIVHNQEEDKFNDNLKKTCIDIREGWANINNFYCSHKRMESCTRVGKLAFCRNTTIHFLNFEIYKRSLYHEGRALCKQVINYGSRTVFPYYIVTMPNKEHASSYLSSSDAWQLCMLSVMSCHQYL